MGGIPVMYGGEPMFVVQMRDSCPHLASVKEVPKDFEKNLDLKGKCTDCEEKDENWICLNCYGLYCSRHVNGHSLRHFTENPDHCMVFSLADLSLWCHACDDYVDNPVALPIRNIVHEKKFDCPVPGPSRV
ncbi:hypothetical protein FO519_004544 [Halicephalobus sp. NKZ332]|nr:hypothetical protein FO519_004544 [Halicephalobus sp. NKZ332]